MDIKDFEKFKQEDKKKQETKREENARKRTSADRMRNAPRSSGTRSQQKSVGRTDKTMVTRDQARNAGKRTRGFRTISEAQNEKRINNIVKRTAKKRALEVHKEKRELERAQKREVTARDQVQAKLSIARRRGAAAAVVNNLQSKIDAHSKSIKSRGHDISGKTRSFNTLVKHSDKLNNANQKIDSVIQVKRQQRKTDNRVIISNKPKNVPTPPQYKPLNFPQQSTQVGGNTYLSTGGEQKVRYASGSGYQDIARACIEVRGHGERHYAAAVQDLATTFEEFDQSSHFIACNDGGLRKIRDAWDGGFIDSDTLWDAIVAAAYVNGPGLMDYPYKGVLHFY